MSFIHLRRWPRVRRHRPALLSAANVSTAATHLLFTTQPAGSTSGVALTTQPVVAAKNSSNATDTTKTGNVVVALNVVSGSPVLSGTTTKALASGVATFTDLVVTGAGTWTLTASLTGLTSDTSSQVTTPGNANPAQPTISAGTPTSSGVTLTGSAFSDTDVGDTHAASQWQVTTSADTGYAATVISTGDDATNKTSYAATGLGAATPYIARVRYKDSAGNYSAWSSNASFTTAAGGTTFTNAIRFSGSSHQAAAAAHASYNDLAAFTVALLMRDDGTGFSNIVSKNNNASTTGWRVSLVMPASADLIAEYATTSGFKRDLLYSTDNAWRWVFVGFNRTNHTVTRAVGPQGGSIADIGAHSQSDGGAGALVSDALDPFKLGAVDASAGGCAINMEVRFVGIASGILTLAQMQAIADDAVSQAALFIDYWKPSATGGSGTSIASGKGVLPALVTSGATVV